MAATGFPAILRAAADGDVAKLKVYLLKGGAEAANAANGIGQTPLHLSSMWGHRSAVELLLKAQADVNIQNQFGVAPLHYAAQKNHYDVAHVLLAHGASTKLRSVKGHLPCDIAEEDEMRVLCGAPTLALHAAVKQRDAAKVTALVSEGYDLSDVDTNGNTALHLAMAADASGSMAAALLSAAEKSDSSTLVVALVTRSEEGLTPLHLAASKGSTELMSMLLGVVPSAEEDPLIYELLDFKTHRQGELYNGQWGKKNAEGQVVELDSEHMTMLHLAIERIEKDDDDDDDDDDEVVSLVEVVDGLEIDGTRVDVAPAKDARADVVEMIGGLIRRGANVNARDAFGRAPLHQAIGSDMYDVAAMLLEAHADPTVGCKAIGMANNALHQATLRGNSQMISLLLKPRASTATDSHPTSLDANGGGQGGWTPLALAARAGNVPAVRALLEGGADPAVVMSNGKTALDIARVNKNNKKHAEIVQLLAGSD